jgi:hypothetical protein
MLGGVFPYRSRSILSPRNSQIVAELTRRSARSLRRRNRRNVTASKERPKQRDSFRVNQFYGDAMILIIPGRRRGREAD